MSEIAKGAGLEDALQHMIEPGMYRYFKNKYYRVFGVAEHTETKELLVVYKALYGDFKTYVRPLNMFLEEVPKEKENPTGQKFRFEYIGLYDSSYKVEGMMDLILNLKSKYVDSNYYLSDEDNFYTVLFDSVKLTDNHDFYNYANELAHKYLNRAAYEKFSVSYDYEGIIIDKMNEEVF